jgi:hypothetical protein
MDCIENTVSKSSFIVAGVLVSCCIAMARFFIDPLSHNGQLLLLNYPVVSHYYLLKATHLK